MKPQSSKINPGAKPQNLVSPIDPVSCAAAATQFVLLAAASAARDLFLKTNNTGARLA